MPRVDKYLQQLQKVRAKKLVLASDAKPTLVTDGGEWPMTTDLMTADQIQAILREIIPAALAHRASGDGDFEFDYASPFGPMRATYSREQERVVLAMHPIEAGAEAPKVAPVETPATAPGMLALLKQMIAQGCSDLHLSTGNPPLFRKDGDITSLGNKTPMTNEQVLGLVSAIASAADRAKFEQQHDADFSYEVPGLARFRCNLFMDRRGMGAVLRVIPTQIPTAEQLGLSKPVLELCHLSKGLIVVTGPTGSGKSTTLAAMIDYINRNINGHLITIEDPIEFVHDNRKCLINQREVGAHTLGFKIALRAALREDPDFVLVGEMRDLETVATAIETAETGHLVFGTLHTNTAASTVDRIIDQFPTDRQTQVRTMLSESLRGVITQVLCKKKGGGRVAAREVLIVNSAISNLIREGKTFQIPSIMQTGKNIGMVCLNDALLELVKQGLVDPMEALGKSAAKTEFKALLARGGIAVEQVGAA